MPPQSDRVLVSPNESILMTCQYLRDGIREGEPVAEIRADVHVTVLSPTSGLEIARILAGSRLKSYRTARSAVPAVRLDPAGPYPNDQQTGIV